MKTHPRKKCLTLGGLIERVYSVCGNRKGRGIVRLAIKAHLIAFRHRGES